MLNAFKWPVFFILAALFNTNIQAASPIPLDVHIIKPDSSSSMTHHATEQLTHYVELMTGANVQIVKASVQKSNDFFLGANLPVVKNPNKPQT